MKRELQATDIELMGTSDLTNQLGRISRVIENGEALLVAAYHLL